MANGLKKQVFSIATAIIVIIGAYVALNWVVCPYLLPFLNNLNPLKQAAYDEAWAKEHGYDWASNYSKDASWGGGVHKKYYNLHGDRQIYDQKTGTMSRGGPIDGFRPNAGLLSQPFSSAFAHTSETFATPMPVGAEIESAASPFAAVPDGHEPWAESTLPMSGEPLYTPKTSRWAGQNASPDTQMFDTYDDNFDYDKASGKITSTPVERIIDATEYGAERKAAVAEVAGDMTEAEKKTMGAGVAEALYKDQPWDQNFVQ